MREWGFFLFFTSFFFLYFTGSMYIAWRVNSGLKTPEPYNYFIYAASGLMAVIATLAYIFSKYNVDPFAYYFSPVGGMWMGIVGISVTVLFANDLINFANLIFKIKDFRYWATAVSLALIVLLCVWSLINTAFILKVKEIKIKMPSLNKDRVSITLLADVHIDKHTSPKIIRKIVNIANSFDSDIIVIAGDLVDMDISQTYAEYGLDKLRAKHGIFAVTGNHEYYSGIENYEKLCEKLGIILLRNENFELKYDGKSIITIAGINDKQAAKQSSDKVDVEAAFANADRNLPVLFLSHRPQYFDLVKDKEIPVIQLSGHTHAGQIPPIEILMRIFFKYPWGLYGHKGSHMYVTSGNRWWRVPMRTFNFSEIAVIVLEK
ncbi:MAG: metallophosphoesterase [Endomicrobia bacterium]|nr:metallophosphoesterase [Endomicrobiia bacterium]